MKLKSNCLSLILTLVLALFSSSVSAQIGIGTPSPHPSAALDVTDAGRGILIPRLTESQKNAVASPAVGLLIYQTDNVAGFYYYTGSNWQVLAASAAGFANKYLSDLLSPTAINVDLIPRNTSNFTLGTPTLAWKAAYINEDVFLGGSRFLSARGINNTFAGAVAGNTTLTGTSNTGVGSAALSQLTAGNNNTALGNDALQKTSTGGNNTASGNQALYNNNIGTGNTASGSFGLFNNTQGSNNTATGVNGLYNNTTGNSNTADGTGALFSNNVGSNNTATGVDAAHTNSSGSYNSAYGYGVMYYNSTGSFNTALGQQASWGNTTGNNNVAVGRWSLYYNSTSSENAAVGYSAGDNTTNPTAGSFFGAQTRASANLTNITAVGYGAVATASNSVRIGNSSVTSIGGQVGWTNFSDGRFKRNVKEDVPGLAFINQLRPVTYSLDVAAIDNQLEPDLPQGAASREGKTELLPGLRKAKEEKGRIRYSGFIAQEVEQTARKLGYDFSGVDAPKNSRDFYGLRYGEFAVPMVKAVQELDKKVEGLKNEKQQFANSQQQEIEALKRMVVDLQKQIAELKSLIVNK